MGQARYIMIGGFLGAGKTSAMLKLAGHLAATGRRCGLITNDQSVNLVDTVRARAAGMAVAEITGGCFCCKFDSLLAAAEQLTRDLAPDALIAEPVGSCTDLLATVSYPLRQMYGGDYMVAPLSVLVDPLRCARILGLEPGQSFTDKVQYVYRKQLEEAELLVVNKIDLLDETARRRLAGDLSARFPQAQVMLVSCRTGEGLEAWFERVVNAEVGRRQTMDVDYEAYADGEARLGWLNARVRLVGEAEVDGNRLLLELATELKERLAAEAVEIAHLKMTLTPSEGPDLGAVSLTDGQPVLMHTLQGLVRQGELMVNLRAEGDPEALRGAVGEAVKSLGGLIAEVLDVRAFRPGRPNPTHRVTLGGAS